MSHDTHFLARLERLEPSQVNFALSLYRNAPLVKLLVARTAPPDAERVAIALAETEGGPHVLVARDGAFVTCLGAGMRTELPIISRAAVDRAMRDHAELRRALERLRQVGRAGALETFAHTLTPHVSREDAQELLTWSPFLGGVYLEAFADAAVYADSAWARVGQKERLKEKRDGRAMRLLWECHWRLANLAAPALPPIRRDWERGSGEFAGTYLADMCFQSFHPTCVLRGAAATASLADMALDVAGEQFAKEDLFDDAAPAALVLAIIALGRPDLRERACAFLAREPRPGALVGDGAAIYRRLREVIDSPRDALDRHLARGSAWLSARGIDPTDLDATDILAAPLHGDGVLAELDSWHALADMVPFAAASRWEELFLPKALLDRLPKVDPDRAAWVAGEALHASAYAPDEEEKPPKVERNAPCPCGSGKKFKKCHGA